MQVMMLSKCENTKHEKKSNTYLSIYVRDIKRNFEQINALLTNAYGIDRKTQTHTRKENSNA